MLLSYIQREVVSGSKSPIFKGQEVGKIFFHKMLSAKISFCLYDLRPLSQRSHRNAGCLKLLKYNVPKWADTL